MSSSHRRGATPAEWHDWRSGIYTHIRDVMSGQGLLNIERMCHLADVSRAGFYRALWEQHLQDEESGLF